MKKFAVLVSAFPALTETFVWKDALEMLRQGADFRIYSLRKPNSPVPLDERVLERTVYAPSFLSFSLWRENLIFPFRRPRAWLSGLGALFQRGCRRPPDHFLKAAVTFPKFVWLAARAMDEGIERLHSHFIFMPTTMAYFMERLSGVPFSFTFHSVRDLRAAGLQEEKIRRAAFIRTVSDYNRSFLLERFEAAKPERILTVRNGLDFESPGAETNPEKKARAGLYVGRLELFEDKGLAYLFDALKILKARGVGVEVDLIGAGARAARATVYAKRTGVTDRARFLGAMPHAEVVKRYPRYAFFVLPSLYEGLPQTLVEAMAAGVPVISTCITGIPELVESSGGGLLVEPRDANALAEAMRFLLDDPERAAEMGAKGRAFVREHYRIDRCVGQLLDAIERH